jgi:hypothetical protein
MSEQIGLIEWAGHWYEQLGDSPLMVPVPGARAMTVRELVGDRLRRTKRYGEWIEIDRETASLIAELRHWCRRHCNSELPSGTLRFAPKDWDKRCNDPMPLPYVPEFDHPSEVVRGLIATERRRRGAEHALKFVQDGRDRLVREATRSGHSRRELAKVLGISFARVQQIAQQRP